MVKKFLKIFEGDIICWKTWDNFFQNASVEYDSEWNRFCVWINGAQSIGANKYLSDDIKIIGNKFNNPELTK